MILLRNRFEKKKDDRKPDYPKVVRQYQQAYAAEFKKLLQDLKKALTIDDIEQSMAINRLTENARAKLKSVLEKFINNNLDKLLRITLQNVAEQYSERLDGSAIQILDKEQWADELKQRFTEQMLSQQEKAIVATSSRVMNLPRYNNIEPEQLARLLVLGAGLDSRSMLTCVNSYSNMLENDIGRLRAFASTSGLIDLKYEQRSDKLAADILVDGYREAEYQTVKEAMDNGTMGQVVKIWSTSGDDRVCDICRELEGQAVMFDEDFVVPSTGQRLTGKTGAHPLCRCGVMYVDKKIMTKDFTK